jgi:hypothetical protein
MCKNQYSVLFQMKSRLAERAAVEGYDKVIQEMTLAELNNYTEYKVGFTLLRSNVLIYSVH